MIIVYFSIYCFLGYWLESIYVSLFRKKWISSGLLNGPFIPLYGFGACILILCQPYLQYFHPFFVCLIGGICMTLLELLSSYYIERFFHTQCWNYSHHALNYQGRICLVYFILWCLLSGLFIYIIHPFICSLSLRHDACYLISLIYISFILKAYGDRLLATKQNGLNIH